MLSLRTSTPARESDFMVYDYSALTGAALDKLFEEVILDDPSFIMHRLRQDMLMSQPPNRDDLISQLSRLYTLHGYYHSEKLDPCEVALTKSQPSGLGGHGACWEGLFLNRHKVALKCSHYYIPSETAARRTEREIKVWKGLRHPNVLPFVGSVTMSPATYMVSPWMKNGDALGYIRRNPNVDCLTLLTQVATGIAYLHTRSPTVVHGGIKATNILINDEGQACIGDFGLSQRLNEGASDDFSTAWRTAGNPRWQAPELLSAETPEEGQRTTSSDIFAFGRVIVELFTRKAPFANVSNIIRVAFLVMSGIPLTRPTEEDVVARGLDDHVWQLVEHCCKTDPSARPSATDVISRLQQIIIGVPQTT